MLSRITAAMLKWNLLIVKKFLKIIHSTENFNQSMSTKIEDVPLLRVFANEGRNFYIEMQNFTEIHVYAESIKEPYHLNILSRVQQSQKSKPLKTKGVWRNGQEFLRDYILSQQRQWTPSSSNQFEIP